MKAYRLTSAAHKAEPLSGIGSQKYGGRWNNKGTAIAYCSGDAALCILEAMVHVGDDGFPDGWLMLEFDLPDDAIGQVSGLPSGWNEDPDPGLVRSVGDQFIAEGKFLAIRVPSAIIGKGYNVLINPALAKKASLVGTDVTDTVDVSRLAKRLSRSRP